MDKNLLTELGIKNINRYVTTFQGKIWYTLEGDSLDSWVDECKFAQRCKRWAMDNGYDLLSSCDGTVGLWTEENSGVWNIRPDKEFYVKDDEYSAIFKACEYILKEIK